MPHQIVFNKFTPDDVWKRLEEKSNQTRIQIDLQCPICEAEVLANDTTQLQCLDCDQPVEVFQQRLLSKKADTRRIYAQANRQFVEIASIELQCLSCQDSITEDETCQNQCLIETYLALEVDDGKLYIKRWVNHINVPRSEIPEIPIATHVTFKETPDSHIPYHKRKNTIREEILALWRDEDFDTPIPTAVIVEAVVEALDTSPTAVKNEIKRTCDKKRLLKVRHGYYRRLR